MGFLRGTSLQKATHMTGTDKRAAKSGQRHQLAELIAMALKGGLISSPQVSRS
jgi:hypothetical protein